MQSECSYPRKNGFKRKMELTGVLMMLYNHETKRLENALTHVQHRYAHIMCSAMHIHISEEDCLEAIAVKGSAAEVRKLSNELATKGGVRLLKTMVVPK